MSEMDAKYLLFDVELDCQILVAWSMSTNSLANHIPVS